MTHPDRPALSRCHSRAQHGCALLVWIACLAATVTGSPASAQVYHFGLPHTAAGDATLGVEPSACKGCLIVSNIGASGEDGVDVELGAADGFASNLRLTDPSILVGSWMATTAMVDDASGTRPIATFRVRRPIADAFLLEVDYASGSTYSITVFAGELLVGEVGGLANDTHDVVLPPSMETFVCTITDEGVWTWNGPTVVTISEELLPLGGDPVVLMGDRIRVTPDDDALPAGRMTEARIRAAAPVDETMQLAVHSEGLGVFGLIHRAAGDAHLVARDHLVVGNIGSSGEDGVRVQMREGGAYKSQVRLTDPAIPPGGWMQSTSYAANPEGLDEIGWSRFRRLGSGNFLIEADYSASNSGFYRLLVFDDKGLVGEVNGLTNDTHDIIIVGASPEVYRCICTNDGVWTWDGPLATVVVTAGSVPLGGGGGSTTLVGHRIQIKPEQPLLSGLPLREIRTVAAGLEQLEILSENVHSTCTGDSNDDGRVDVDDLINVLLDWGTDGSAHNGDINLTNFVDKADVITVIHYWGPC
ncbi:MAG: hypothetical protein ACYTGC_06095 [Planctomycetota bacterium]|jgi:hypothetical protein